MTFLLFTFVNNAKGQCSCVDCDLTLTNSIVQSTLTISGSTNSTLGQGGQYLKSISISVSALEIGEYQINLIAPSGDVIVLSTSNNEISTTDETFFDICFTSCNLGPIPPSGFSVFFDSSEDYLPLNTYTGSYYPIQSLGPPYGSLGCLETLTGSVNGDWILEFDDEWLNTTQDGGLLTNWSLEFADNSGTICTNNTCSQGPPPCDLVEYGFEIPAPQIFCEGDPILDFSNNPVYFGTSGHPNIYGIKYYVVDATDGIILEVSLTEPDMTGYLPGDYEIYTIQFLQTDESFLPELGENLYDMLPDIDAGIYCAFYTGRALGILENFIDPQLDWDATDELCSGISYDFNILNYDSNYEYTAQISSGGFSEFIFQNGVLSITPMAGPLSICISIVDDCDEAEICKTFTVISGIEQPILDAPTDICLNSSFQVDVLNDPLAPLYNWSISGPGTILTDNNSSITVFNNGPGVITICANASSPECGSSSDNCLDINVIDIPPPTILADPIYCLPGGLIVGNANGGASSTVYTQIGGPGTIIFYNPNVVTTAFTVDLPGIYTILLTKISNGCTVTTTATFEVINGLELPIISGPSEVCSGNTYEVEVLNIQTGSSYNWSISGPGVIQQNLGTSVIILSTNSGLIEVCVTPENPECGPGQEVCLETSILDANLTAPQLNEFDLICIENSFSVFGDPSSLNYNWVVSGSGIIEDIISNHEIIISPTSEGIITICANLIDPLCGDSPQTCFDVEVVNPANPSIIADIESCFPGGEISGILNDVNNALNWEFIEGPGNLTFTNPFSISTTYAVDVPGVYQISLTENNIGCVRSDTIEITVLDEIQTDVEVICSGSSFVIEITFLSGLPPYNVLGTEITGNVYLSPEYPSGSAVLTTYSDANNCVGEYFTQTFCNCISDAGTMSSSQINLCSLSDIATATHNNDATLDSDDIGVYILHTSSSSVLGTIIASNTTGGFPFTDPPMNNGQTYYISYVVGNNNGGSIDLNDPCLSVAVGQQVKWFEVGITPSILSDPDPCDQSLQLTVVFDTPVLGSNQWDWTVISGPPGGVATFSCQQSGCPPIVEFSEPGTYVVRFTLTYEGCDYTADITLNIEPSFNLSNPIIICDESSGTFQVSFDLTGGTPPYSIDGSPVAGNNYVSNPIPVGTAYSFDASDSGPCPNVTINGIDNCGCTSSAGSMPAGTLTYCDDDLAMVTVTNPVLDNNDIGVYILHDLGGNVIGNIFDQNTIGTFGLLPSMNTGQTYYISYVVGNDLGGSIDLNDQCLSVSEGQPVVWNEQPTVTLPINLETCDSEIELQALYSIGNIFEWQFISQPLGSNPIITNNTSAITTIVFDISGSYELQFSASNNGCIAYDTILIEFYENPVIYNFSENCNSDTYTISFEIDSDFPDFIINGMSQSSNSFTSSSINSGDSYSFIVEDSNGCSTFIEGIVNCDCISDAGTMDNNLLEQCGTIDTFIISNNEDFVLDNNDIGVYILHEGSGPFIVNEIRIQNSPLFEFNSDVQLDVIYYVSYVVGNSTNTGSIDLTDPCLSVTTGTPIIWRSFPISQYPDSISVCEGEIVIPYEEIALDITDIQFSQIQGPSTSNITDGNNEILIEMTSIGNYIFEYTFFDGFCESTDSLFIDFDSLSISPIVESCDLENDVYQISFSFTSGTPPYYVNGDIINGNTFISESIPSGNNYSFSIEDENQCNSIVLTGSVSCNCSNKSGDLEDNLVELCQMDTYNTDYLTNPIDSTGYDNVFVLHDGTNSSLGNIYQIYNSNEINYFSVIPLNTILLLSPVSASFEGTNININDPCLSIGLGTPIIWHETASIEITTTNAEICEGDTATITIQIEGLPYPYEFFIFQNGVQDTFIVNSSDPFEIDFADVNENEYQLNLGDYPCVNPSSNTEFSFNIISCNCITQDFTFNDSICYMEGNINLNEWKNENINGIWSLEGGTGINFPILSDSILNVQDASTGTVFLNWIPTDLLSCDSVYSLELFIQQYDEIFLFQNQIQFCPETDQLIDLNQLLSDPSISGEWVSTPQVEGLIDENGLLKIEALDIGDYTLELILDNYPFICSQEDIILNITITDPLNYLITSTNPACYGEDGILNIEILDGETDISSISVNNNEVSFPYNLELPFGFYSIEITDENFCQYFESIEIIEPDELNVDLDTLTIPNSEGDVFKVSAITDIDPDSIDFVWFENGIEMVGLNNNSITFSLPDSTEISVIITDENGCTAEDFIILSLFNFIEDIEIVMPNIFLPLSTSDNSLFAVPPTDNISVVNQFLIYDRWGNKVFETSNFVPWIDNQSWDGTMNGSMCSAGVYVYFVNYIDITGQEKILTGDVTLFK